jgi:hypothetical protein
MHSKITKNNSQIKDLVFGMYPILPKTNTLYQNNISSFPKQKGSTRNPMRIFLTSPLRGKKKTHYSYRPLHTLGLDPLFKGDPRSSRS